MFWTAFTSLVMFSLIRGGKLIKADLHQNTTNCAQCQTTPTASIATHITALGFLAWCHNWLGTWPGWCEGKQDVHLVQSLSGSPSRLLLEEVVGNLTRRHPRKNEQHAHPGLLMQAARCTESYPLCGAVLPQNPHRMRWQFWLQGSSGQQY